MLRTVSSIYVSKNLTKNIKNVCQSCGGASRSTKKYLHLLVDHFTRYAFIITSKTQSAHDFIKLINKVTDTQEIKILLSHQYLGINSKEFKELRWKKKLGLQ